MLPKPVEEASTKRPAGEKLCFDDKNIIYKDLEGNFVEYQFEELRLRDIRSQEYGRELLRSSYNNPLDKLQLSQRIVNSPTINTKFALDELGPLLIGTPQIKSGINQPVMDGRTVDFQGLELSIEDMKLRNEGRGISNTQQE